MTIGIDLGTTKSAIGYWHDNKPVITKINDQFSMPSEVYFYQNKVQVGYRSADGNPIFFGAIKRHLGSQAMLKVSNHKAVHPQYIAAFILKQLKKYVEDDMHSKGLNEEVREAVIAIPSHFDIYQRRATLEAAKIAGISVKRLINEATASCLDFSRSKGENNGPVMIVDIGGGTLDISIVHISTDDDTLQTMLEVKYIDGHTNLGGVDFDEVIFKWVKERIDRINKTESNINRSLKDLIKSEIAQKKVRLCEQESIKLYNPLHAINRKIDVYSPFNLSQQKFLDLSVPLFERITSLVENSINYFNKRENNIQDILLLGRASKLYGLKEHVQKRTELKCYTPIDPEVCVAKGAVMQAAIFDQKLEEKLVIEVLQDYYGIELEDDKYHVFFEKGGIIPQDREWDFETKADNQTEIEIKVLKGSRPKASENSLMQTIKINNIDPAPAGYTKIKVRFSMNADMILKVTILNVRNKNLTYTIDSPDRLSENQILEYQKSVEDLL